jgi:hypothetical protein
VSTRMSAAAFGNDEKVKPGRLCPGSVVSQYVLRACPVRTTNSVAAVCPAEGARRAKSRSLVMRSSAIGRSSNARTIRRARMARSSSTQILGQEACSAGTMGLSVSLTKSLSRSIVSA